MPLDTQIQNFVSRVAAEFNRFTALSGLSVTATNHGVAAGARVPNSATTDGAIRALTPQLGQDWGTAFPASTWPGRQFLRTDIDGGTIFWWDDSRSKWLGELMAIEIGEPGDDDRIHFGRSEVSNLAADGAVFPFDVTIVRAFGNTRTNVNETMTLSFFQDSVTSFVLDWAAGASADTGAIDIDWDAGVLLNGRVTSIAAPNFNRLYGQIQFRRVAL